MKKLTIAQAAKELGISKNSVRIMILTGKLRASMQSGDGKRDHYVIDQDSFDDVMEFRMKREQLEKEYFGK